MIRRPPVSPRTDTPVPYTTLFRAVRICSNKSQFGMPAARLSLGYPFTAIKRLANIVGIANARHLMFTAGRIDAAHALRIGLVQEIVPSETLDRKSTRLNSSH